MTEAEFRDQLDGGTSYPPVDSTASRNVFAITTPYYSTEQESMVSDELKVN